MIGRQRALRGKVALITGGARGLGAAVARELSTRGVEVAIVDRNPAEPGHPVASRALFLTGDVTDAGDMRNAVEQVVERFGRLDVVVANAGVAARGATLRATAPDSVERIFAINVGGTLTTIRAALPQVIAHQGSVVVVSSVFSYVNGAGTLPYAMTKAAVEQLGRGLRVELAAHGVDVVTAYFSMIDTEMIRASVDADPTATALLDRLPPPLRKRITPEIAARAIVRGVERGRPSVMRPRRWAAMSAARGVVGPLLDEAMLRDTVTQGLLAELDVRSGQDRLTS